MSVAPEGVQDEAPMWSADEVELEAADSQGTGMVQDETPMLSVDEVEVEAPHRWPAF